MYSDKLGTSRLTMCTVPRCTMPIIALNTQLACMTVAYVENIVGGGGAAVVSKLTWFCN